MADEKKNTGMGMGLGGAVGSIVGTGLGMATAGWQDKRQLEQQKKLQALEIKGSKEMAEFNRGLAMQMWQDTGYGAQRKQMEQAGLNVGLMYGGGGAGGGTASAPGGHAGGGQAAAGSGEIGMGIQLGLQAEMMAAQIEATKAATNKTNIEADKLKGVDTGKVGAEIENLKQTTTNAKVQASIMEYEKQLKEIEANVAGLTQEEVVKQMRVATDKLIAETNSAQARGEIDQATKGNVIKGAELANQATSAGITATKAGTIATQASTKATEASTKQTEQNTKNLAQDEINKMLANAMKASGIEPTDNTAVRMMQRWLSENNVSMESVAQKMNKIGAWMKGEYGAQTWERLTEIMKE